MICMKWHNKVTSLLNITYPVVQAPMLGITTPEMVAAVSEAGGLGSLPVGGLSADQTRELVRAVKALTSKPFAVNLFAHSIPSSIDTAAFTAMQQFLTTFAAANDITYVPPVQEMLRFHTYHDQIDILLSEQIPSVSFTFGIPEDEYIAALKNRGARLIGTATCVEEALLLDNKFVDVITAQGAEAGGHRGTFITEGTPPMIGTMSLVPQIVDATRRPVLAAGGIADGSTMMAAMMLGAQGVQVGSAFLVSNESSAPNAHKHRIQNASASDAVLTKNFSGRWARGIENKLMRAISESGLTTLPYPYQQSLTASIRSFAQQKDLTDFTTMWAGQSASKAVRKPAAAIFRTLIDQAQTSFEQIERHVQVKD
nr:nitronate monooxygenase [Pseudobacter ginsenosidimutans]